MPSKQNRPREEEDQRLLEMEAAGRPNYSIAAALRRSIGGVEAGLPIVLRTKSVSNIGH